MPDSIVVDSSYETTLADEYLLNVDGLLEIEKRFTTKLSKVFIRANHPTHEKCKDLLGLKNKDLKKIVEELQISCENQSINSIMRKAIRENFSTQLGLSMREIDVSKGDDVKSIWGRIQEVLPIYSLFQSDRENSDNDDEVQDPLRESAKKIISDPQLQTKLHEIADSVIQALHNVADRTYAKLHEMAPDVASGLSPRVPTVEELKWVDVFKSVSITGADNIPINKRGSGVKRLVLLNFFRAEAEQQATDGRGIIYAIEEPETSQHFEHQRLLVSALVDLSSHPQTQVLLSTHSPVIVKGLGLGNLRLVRKNDGNHEVGMVNGGVLQTTSLNEVAYLAFGAASDEYHDELWGVFAGDNDLLNQYRVGRPQRPYVRVMRDGSLRNENKILSEYIRDVMHHPENNNNIRFTVEELQQSIEEMRTFISHLRASGTL